MDDISSQQFGPLTNGQLPARPGHQGQKQSAIVYFVRTELSQILNVYGRIVASGEWRDYAIDHQTDQAVFSIYRRTSEMPLYRIVKEPALANQQGAWRILGAAGQILKRGKKLDQLLRYFDRHQLKAVK